MSNQEDSKPVVPATPVTPAVKPIVPAAPEEKVSADVTAQQLMEFLKLYAAKEARAMAVEASAEKSYAARAAQREKSTLAHVQKQLVKQSRCRHLKGGRKGPRSGVLDYAVYLHTFINGESRIKCFICNMAWRGQDTVDFLVRNGRQIANHTKIGWAQAQGFLMQSTNTASASEVPMQAKPVAEFSGVEIS
jgi:hypothetical protein